METKLKKIGGVYHVNVPAAGHNKYISTGSSTKVEAEKVLAESSVEQLSVSAKSGRLTRKAIGQILTGKNLTCEKALEEYFKVKSLSKSALTLRNIRSVITNWMKIAKVESLPPSAIKPAHIADWINDPESKWNRAYRITNLAIVRSFFRFMAEEGWIISNPLNRVEIDYSVMSHEQKESPEKIPFTEDEVKTLIRALTKDWAQAQSDKHELFRNKQWVLFWLIAVHIGKETGLRISDIAQLAWRSFSEPGLLVVWTEKTNRRVEHKIGDTIQNLVSEIPVVDAEYLFPDQRKLMLHVTERQNLSIQFVRLCEKLGIHGKSFHHLRHHAATSKYAKMDKSALAKKLAESLSLEQIAGLLGHSNSKTSKRYVHE